MNDAVRPRASGTADVELRPPIVVVLNGYSRHNTGDWLLLEEAVALARAENPGHRVVAIALDPRSFRGRTTADEVLPSPVAMQGAARGLLQTIVGFATRGRYGSPALKAIRQAEAAYSVGGGFIQFRSPRELATAGLGHATQLIAARWWGPTVELLPQSIGPFSGTAARALGRFTLLGINPVRVRDLASSDRLAALGGSVAQRTVSCPDMVFYEPRQTHPVASPPQHIGVVVRNWWFPGTDDPGERERRYLSEVAEYIDRSVAAGIKVTLVVHSDGPAARGDDRIATEAVRAQLAQPVEVVSVCGAPSPEVAASHYRDYDLVVSVRMHAALLALREGIPAVAIGYEAKSSEILGQLGLAEFVVDIDDVSSETLSALTNRPYPSDEVSARWQALHNELRAQLQDGRR